MSNPYYPSRLKVADQIHDNDGAPETVITSEDGIAYVAVALDFGRNNPLMREANARRMVACWNAFNAPELTTKDIVSMTDVGGVHAIVHTAGALDEELAAARALLREVLADYERERSDGIYADDVETERSKKIRSYLDACDTLGGGA